MAAFFENDRLDPSESTQYLPWIQENCNVEGIDFPIRNESQIMLVLLLRVSSIVGLKSLYLIIVI